MFPMLLSFLRSFRLYFKSRADLQMEILALRHQIVVLQRQTPKPKLKSADRRFWVGLSQFWSRWREALWIVKPDTVIDWHRRGSVGTGPGRFAMDSQVGHVSRKKRATSFGL